MIGEIYIKNEHGKMITLSEYIGDAWLISESVLDKAFVMDENNNYIPYKEDCKNRTKITGRYGHK